MCLDFSKEEFLQSFSGFRRTTLFQKTYFADCSFPAPRLARTQAKQAKQRQGAGRKERYICSWLIHHVDLTPSLFVSFQWWAFLAPIVQVGSLSHQTQTGHIYAKSLFKTISKKAVFGAWNGGGHGAVRVALHFTDLTCGPGLDLTRSIQDKDTKESRS